MVVVHLRLLARFNGVLGVRGKRREYENGLQLGELTVQILQYLLVETRECALKRRLLARMDDRLVGRGDFLGLLRVSVADVLRECVTDNAHALAHLLHGLLELLDLLNLQNEDSPIHRVQDPALPGRSSRTPCRAHPIYEDLTVNIRSYSGSSCVFDRLNDLCL